MRAAPARAPAAAPPPALTAPRARARGSTNHMLWFANASDGPTWYVGKKEEFGQARGWLQVKSDAASPAEIRGTWGIWSAAEKVGKDGRDVKCVAVSATPGVYIFGITPNNLLQDKLGEYRRVQLRVITERGVYEMVGMSNVMMWYAPGGPRNLGKRAALGPNRGRHQAARTAISPQGIPHSPVLDSATRQWDEAHHPPALLGALRTVLAAHVPARFLRGGRLGRAGGAADEEHLLLAAAEEGVERLDARADPLLYRPPQRRLCAARRCGGRTGACAVGRAEGCVWRRGAGGADHRTKCSSRRRRRASCSASCPPTCAWPRARAAGGARTGTQ